MWSAETQLHRGTTASRSNLSQQNPCSLAVTEACYRLFRPGSGPVDQGGDGLNRSRQRALAIWYFSCGLLANAASTIDDETTGLLPYERLLDAAHLAFVSTSVGDLETAAEQLKRISSIPLGGKDDLSVARLCAQSRFLGAIGKTDEALGLLHSRAFDPTNPIVDDLAHPLIAELEILFDGRRFDDVVRAAGRALDGRNERIETTNAPIVSRALDRQSEALARLGRWQEALKIRRRAERARCRFDIDAERLARLIFPDGYPTTNSIHRSHLTDSYARGCRFRDALGHDLRNVLSGVQLLTDGRSEDRDELAKQMDHLDSLLTRMEHTRENAEAYAALVSPDQSRGLRPNRGGPTSVAEEVDRILERYTAEADAKGITLERECSPSLMAAIEPMILRAIVSNLLGNAIKFSHSETTIRVGWTLNQPRHDEERFCVRISVRDEGPGLTSQDIENIYRNANTPWARAAGTKASTGTGLQIVYGFAQTLGGYVSTQNHPEGGARFSVTLPVIPPSAARNPVFRPKRVWAPTPSGSSTEPAQPPPNPALPANLRAVAADDDPLMGCVLSAMFDRLSVEARIVSSVDEAADMLETSTGIDLFVTDVMFDGSPVGLELAARATALWPDATVVVCSGLEVSPTEVGDDVLIFTKPLRLTNLQSVLEAHRAQRPPLSWPGQPGSLRPDLSGRLKLLNEAAKGRSVPEDVLASMLEEQNPEVRIDALTIASIVYAIRRDWSESLALGREATRLIFSSNHEPPIEVRWQLSNNIGLVLLEMGRYHQARVELERNLGRALDQNYSYGISRSAINLALVLAELNQIDEAANLMVQAGAWVGTDQTARARLFAVLGDILRQQGATTLAVALLRGALDRFSTIEVDDVRMTLHRLAKAYAQLGNLEDLAVVASRLRHLAHKLDNPPLDLALLGSIEGATALQDGNIDQAIAKAGEAFDRLVALGEVDGAGLIAFSTLVEALHRKGHFELVAQRFANLTDLEAGIRTPTTLRTIARCCEAVGDHRSAYEHETEASRLQAQKNVGLGVLVELARTLSAEPCEVVTDLTETRQIGTGKPRTRPISGFVADFGHALDESRSVVNRIRLQLSNSHQCPDTADLVSAIDNLAATILSPCPTPAVVEAVLQAT